MKLRQLLYFIKQAVGSISNNLMVHLIGMGTMAISLLIFGTFLFLFINLNTWLHGWGHTLSMSVYLADGIDDSALKKITSTLKDLPNAKIQRYISKDDALKDLKQALGNESGLIRTLSENPLPASLELVFKDMASPDTDAQKIKQMLLELAGITEVQYSADWLNRFKGLMDMVRLVGVAIGGLLCLGVLFIVTNTIKLTIYSRKHEIEIQKLVGATDWFVKMPFLLEGFIQGILSGGVALLFLFLGYLFLADKQINLLGVTMLDFVFLPGGYALTIVFISAVLGLAGSFIAVGRFIAAESLRDL